MEVVIFKPELLQHIDQQQIHVQSSARALSRIKRGDWNLSYTSLAQTRLEMECASGSMSPDSISQLFLGKPGILRLQLDSESS